MVRLLISSHEFFPCDLIRKVRLPQAIVLMPLVVLVSSGREKFSCVLVASMCSSASGSWELFIGIQLTVAPVSYRRVAQLSRPLLGS